MMAEPTRKQAQEEAAMVSWIDFEAPAKHPKKF
jgi:hypothetical protein